MAIKTNTPEIVALKQAVEKRFGHPIESRTDFILLFLGACLALTIIAIFLIKFVAGVYVPFVEDRDFIRMEIARSHGNERAHWKHELKRLYISQIPFIGASLAERSRRKSREQRKRI